MTNHAVDRKIENLARSQHGVFSRQQALDVGATARIVERRRAAGRWIRLGGQVYALPSHPATFERQAIAAQLSLDGSAVTGLAAAHLHGFPRTRPVGIELAVRHGHTRRSQLARSRQVGIFETVQVSGIRCVTPRLAVAHLADRLGEEEFVDLATRAVQAKLVLWSDLGDLVVAFAASRRRGHARLRRLVDAHLSDTCVPESELERRGLRLLRRAGLRDLQLQPPLPWLPQLPYRLDALCGPLRLIVEFDGRRYHDRLADMESDRARDLAASAHGYVVIRLTWRMVVDDPEGTIDQLRSALRERRQLISLPAA